MSIIQEVAAELFSMFMADRRLTVATLALVAIVAVITPIQPLVGGIILFCGCAAIVVEAAVREAKRRREGT
jgi:hypothetical protein